MRLFPNTACVILHLNQNHSVNSRLWQVCYVAISNTVRIFIASLTKTSSSHENPLRIHNMKRQHFAQRYSYQEGHSTVCRGIRGYSFRSGTVDNCLQTAIYALFQTNCDRNTNTNNFHTSGFATLHLVLRMSTRSSA
jgi:hypothetical protein